MENQGREDDGSIETPGPDYPRLELDPEDFRDEMDEWDCSEAQKQELLRIIWEVVRSCVELELNVNVIQILLPDIFHKSAKDSVNMVEPKD